MQNRSNDIESKVMENIVSGRVKLRSRYLFLAERVAFGSAVLFGALAAALIFSLVFFYVRETETLKYFVFGRAGLYAFLESFPFGSVIVFVGLSFVTALLLRRADISYRKPFIFVVGFLLLFIVSTGFVLAKTRAMDMLERVSRQENFTGHMMRPFFGRGRGQLRKFGVVGRVISIQGEKILMQTPEGVREIQFAHVRARAEDLVPGAFIMGIGSAGGKGFQMQQFRVVPEDEAGIMRRRVHEMK